ncbi:glyoxylase-like metal-dependent hydrolase (beta-lactamase superfamily II) [Bacillus pakistanensis]|uniref:Glyoxylase-like metal-dependent hydrolase (Beta-lactamase superfamily II) n=1 Tax=Rossellomorea pakistanensis TaxID=992288 RepID=A0ABS2NFL8_9BACI|nr:MBL fold metallo-hydrolase [Bacillus pakistanensis]MBM7586642.1 glyoxylase-like metal-dependent hydrolase (beta-lactamase superfamily II) [Bacillus pakistanensis]
MNQFHLDKRIELIDLFDLGMPLRTGSYIIREKELTIVETSASPSIPYLLKGLKKLNIDPNEIKNIIVTHIHLDHSGGVGLLLKECPNAKVIVHPRGAKHLIDPTKLEAGARQVYGNKFDSLFKPLLPVPENKVIVKGHLDTLIISDDCTLTFYDTPGHAKHHFSIYDPVSNGMFTGDTAGINYTYLLNEEFYLPSTSPTQFSPEDMDQSIQFYRNKNLSRIFYGHFGMTENPSKGLTDVQKWLKIFLQCGEKANYEENNFNEKVEKTHGYISEVIRKSSLFSNRSPSNPIYKILELDLSVSSMGIIDYLSKRK